MNRPQVGVGIIVIKTVGQERFVLLHQRKTPLGEGSWGSGGGHLELGESLAAGALREFREEAGSVIKITPLRFIGVANFTDRVSRTHYVDVSFVADWIDGEAHDAEPEKKGPWQWFAINSLPEPLFPPLATYLQMLEENSAFYDSSFTT